MFDLRESSSIRTWFAVALSLAANSALRAQEPVRKPAAIAAPATAVAQDPEAAQKFGFMPSMLRYHSGDALPDITVLAADGNEVALSSLRAKSLAIVIVLPGIGADPRMQSALQSAKTIAERYAGYGVKTLVGGIWMPRSEFLVAATEQAAKWPFTLFGEPVEPFAGPKDDQDARMAHHRQTVMGKLFQGGMTSPLPMAFVTDAEGKLVGTFAPRGDKVPFDGIANLLLRAGVKLSAQDQPSEVAPASVFAKPAPRPVEAPVQLVAVGTEAKDFVMHDAAGKTVKLADYAGKIVVLDFWATWCGPCKAALPHVQEVAAKYRDQGVVVVASCTNDGRAAFAKFVAEHAATYPDIVFACDPLERSPERASRTLYGVSGIPQQFVIGRDGKIASMVDGYLAGEVLLDAALAVAGVDVDPAVIAQAAQDRAKRVQMEADRAAARRRGK